MKGGRKAFILVGVLGVLLQACATPPKPDYSKFFEHHPRSILVVPSFNQTTGVEAPVVFNTTVSRPFAERGYYVFPVFLTRDILRDLGLTDEGLIAEMTSQRFRETFGADAVLFTTILDWSTKYLLLKSTVTVKVNYRLVDTRSGDVIWERTRIAQHQSGGGGSGNPLADLIVMAIDAAITAAVVDYRPLARQANLQAVNPKGYGIPAGPYHPEYKKDYPSYQEGQEVE